VRPHVADGRSLTSGPRGRRPGGRRCLTGSSTIGKAAPYFRADLQLAASESPCPRDRRTRAVIGGPSVLKDPKHSFSAVGGP